MRISKQSLALAAILAVCGLFLASCGGGSGGGSSATTINGISVPPEPDATQNNATLAGVDSNANGVRDDVERKIAEKTSDPAIYAQAIKQAAAYQKTLAMPTPTTKSEAMVMAKAISCGGQSVEDVIAAGKSSYEAVKTLEQDTFNTDARKEKLQAMNSLMRGGYEGGEVTCNE